jgi:hypothetical protein
MTRTLPTPVHVRPCVCFLRPVPLRGKLSWDADRFGQIPLLPRKGLLTQSTTLRLTDLRVHTQLLSRASQWSRGREPSSWRWPTTRFTGLISPACDRYIQYLLTGANSSVLNWHRQGLQPWRFRLFIYHSPTFPTSCLPFPLKALSGLRLSKQHLSTELERVQALNLTSESIHSTSIVTYHLSIAWANDVPPRWG